MSKSHGMSDTRQYKIWECIVQRCTNPNYPRFYDYGGRGITVCEKWLTFIGFWEDMRDGYSDDLQIDRINVNLGYFKENCKWATLSENAYNQRIAKNNKSGKTGVKFDKTRRKFIAFIQENGSQKYLGIFENFEEAVEVRKKAELKIYGYNKE